MVRAAARLFRVAGGRATILCLKTKGGPRGPEPAHVCPHLPASEQTDLQRKEGRKRTCAGLGHQCPGHPEPSTLQARIPPVHSFAYLIIHKASQVLKTKPNCSSPCHPFCPRLAERREGWGQEEGSSWPRD